MSSCIEGPSSRYPEVAPGPCRGYNGTMTIAPVPQPRRRRLPAGLARYAREIVIVLIVKVFAMVAIWHVWFSGPARKGVDADRVAERIYSSKAPAKREGPPHARP